MSEPNSLEMEIINSLKRELATEFKGFEIKPSVYGKNRIFVNTTCKANKNALKIMWEKFNARVSTISGVDFGRTLGVVYHLILDEYGINVNIKVNDVSKDNPELDSISDIVPAAEFMEREVHDLFGINFKGNPCMERWIIADDWPEGKYPLRKDYKPGG
ncbi:MAG: NADH-quinone oxidoreductase subunit C [Candidatus Bathyarchaeia archaeon]